MPGAMPQRLRAKTLRAKTLLPKTLLSKVIWLQRTRHLRRRMRRTAAPLWMAMRLRMPPKTLQLAAKSLMTLAVLRTQMTRLMALGPQTT